MGNKILPSSIARSRRSDDTPPLVLRVSRVHSTSSSRVPAGGQEGSASFGIGAPATISNPSFGHPGPFSSAPPISLPELQQVSSPGDQKMNIKQATAPPCTETRHDDDESGDGSDDENKGQSAVDAELENDFVEEKQENANAIGINVDSKLPKCGVVMTQFGHLYEAMELFLKDDSLAADLRLEMQQFTLLTSIITPMKLAELQKLTTLFLPAARERVIDFRRFGREKTALPLLLECLADLEILHNRFVEEGESVDEMKMQKVVAGWLKSSAKAEFHAALRRRTKILDESMTNVSIRIHASWVGLISASDDLVVDVGRLKKDFAPHFQRILSVDVVALTSCEYARKLFDHVVKLCGEMARRQTDPNDFSSSLELYRDFCPRFIDAMNFFEEYSADPTPQFKPYALFYKIVANAIEDTTSKQLSAWVESAIRLESEEECGPDTTTCSPYCMEILNIVFGLLEIVYEIDFLVRKSQGQYDCPKSLVFVYFDNSLRLLVNYMAHLKEQILRKANEVTEKMRVRRLVANMQKVLSEFEAKFEVKGESDGDEDGGGEFRVAEALVELSSGGESMKVNMDTPMDMPCFRNPFEEMRILRNEVAVVFSSTIYKEHCNAIDQALLSSNAQVAVVRSRRFVADVRASLLSISDSLCSSFVAKVAEYVYILFINLMIRKLVLDPVMKSRTTVPRWYPRLERPSLCKKDPRTVCLNIEVLLPEVFDLFSCAQRGVAEAVLQHHQDRLTQIMGLFEPKMTPTLLLQLYRRMSNRTVPVPSRDLDYYVRLPDLGEDDTRLIHPVNVLRVIEFVSGGGR